MKIRRLLISLVMPCGAAAAITSCDGVTSGPPNGTGADAHSIPAHPRRWRPAPPAVRAEVYVTQANGAADGVVFAYGAQNKSDRPPQCAVTGQKFDHSQIATDASGNLYSPNLETGAINVYRPHCGSLIASVTDPYGADIDVAVYGPTFYGVGYTHVAVCSTSGCTSELTDRSIRQLETAAVDSGGNVWASYYDLKGATSLIVWPHGAMPGKRVKGYVNPNTPGDLEFDAAGRLLSLQTLFTHLYVYHCVASAATCKNTRIVNLHGGTLFGTLNAKNTDYQAADYSANAVDVYAYPSFKYEYSYSNGLMSGYSVQGIAQAPAPSP